MSNDIIWVIGVLFTLGILPKRDCDSFWMWLGHVLSLSFCLILFWPLLLGITIRKLIKENNE